MSHKHHTPKPSVLRLEALEARLLMTAYDGLRVTEVMYNPDAVDNTLGYTSQDFEYIELQNVGTTTIAAGDLKKLRISEGTDYSFSTETQGLAPGQYIVVARNQAAMALRYDTSAIRFAKGVMASGLGSLDERIQIEYPDATKPDGYATVIDFTYNPALIDSAGNPVKDNEGNPIYDVWFPITDKGVFTLTVDTPSGVAIDDLGDRDNWRPSSVRYGTPGQADAVNRQVVINEVLAHSDELNGDWIELHNLASQPVDISYWFLTDDLNELKKYQIAAGTVIPALGYLVFNQEDHFGETAGDPGRRVGFGMSEYGDTVILSSGALLDDGDPEAELTGLFEEKDFGASIRSVSFGRYAKSTNTYNFVAMSVNTPGGVNGSPLTGPIIISEIMYHPKETNKVEPKEEYIELFNISGQDVTLQTYDATLKKNIPWKFTAGIDYTFPLDTVIPAGGRLIVAQDIAVYKSTYCLNGTPVDGAQVLGPFENTSILSNAGERLELGQPVDELTPEKVREYIRIDRVNYDDKAPWPVSADGAGTALVRREVFSYGNDSTNWVAATPQNNPPRINQLTGQPDPVLINESFTLAVGSGADLDGSIKQIQFYRDINRNGMLDSHDTLLGTDTSSGDGWQWQGSSTGMNNGENTFFAIATDNKGKMSGWISATITIKAPNQAPTLGSVIVLPDQVALGQPITLTANNFIDSDGRVTRANFYIDSNKNGALDNDDVMLGQDRNSADGLKWTGSTASFPLGTSRLFVKVLDNDGEWSQPVTVTVTVAPQNIAPVLNGLQVNPAGVIQTDSMTLTAVGVSDSDGTVSKVSFYEDVNYNGELDGSDYLLGVDTNGQDEWSFVYVTSTASQGQITFFAQAMDDDKSLSLVATATGEIRVNEEPVIAGLTAQPQVINAGDQYILTAAGVSDPDSPVSRVSFYLDVNKNGRIDSAADTLLGTDEQGGDGWSLTGAAADLPAGLLTFLAIARDGYGAVSAVVSTAARLNQAPVAGTLTVTPDEVIQGEPMTLALTGYSDADGSIASAIFYRDVNRDNLIDETDVVLGQDTNAADGLSLVIPTENLPVGGMTFLALVHDNDGQRSSMASAIAGIEQYDITLDPAVGNTVTYTEADGTVVQLTLSKGTADLLFTGRDIVASVISRKWVLSGQAQLASVELLDDACLAATLSFKTSNATKGGDLQAELGSITGVGVKSIGGKLVNLAGAIDVTGNIGAIVLNNLLEGSSIAVGGTLKGVSLTAMQVGDDVNITVNDILKKFQATEYAGGQLTANSITSVAITTGDLGANLTATTGAIGTVTVAGDISGRIQAASMIKSVTTRQGALTASGVLLAQNGDIATVTIAGAIEGTVNAQGSVKALTSRSVGLNNAVVRAGLDIGKITAPLIDSGLISAGRHINTIQSQSDIIDSMLLCGYDIGADAMLGSMDAGERLNGVDKVQITAIKTGNTGKFDGSFALAGVAPYLDGLNSTTPTIIAPDKVDQALNPAGGIIKSATIGQVWQGGDGSQTQTYGLFAATSIGKVAIKTISPAGSGAPVFEKYSFTPVL